MIGQARTKLLRPVRKSALLDEKPPEPLTDKDGWCPDNLELLLEGTLIEGGSPCNRAGALPSRPSALRPLP